MTRHEQKQEELAIVRLYVSAYGLSGRIEPAESPDFILHTSGERIGIEIIEYHQLKYPGDKFNRTAYEKTWDELREAVVEYREKHAGLENLSVSLDFLSLTIPNRRQYQQFIRDVHREIGSIRDHLTSRQTIIRVDASHSALLREFISAIRVRKVSGYREWQSQLHGSGWVGTNEDELLLLLSGKINRKRLGGFDQVHLVMDGGGPSVGTHIGMILPEWLSNWAKLNCALERSSYDVFAILNYRKLFIWDKCRGWSDRPILTESKK